jgi:hypothetical protein
MVPVGPTCVECLHKLIYRATAAACNSEPLRERAVAAAVDFVEKHKDRAKSPAHLANRFHPVIREICRNPDPFAGQKLEEMQRASELAEKYRPPEGSSLDTFVVFAARGNVIDFFRPSSEIEQWLRHAPDFARNHIDFLREKLESGSRRVLYLADNAGEYFFDLPLLDHLARAEYTVHYAVKSGPVQNDLCIADLDPWLHLAPVPVVETGAATVGLEIESVSGDFLDLYERADIILAKGMGHFETLGGDGDRRLFLVLMAKCPPVAEALGVEPNRLAACFPAIERRD